MFCNKNVRKFLVFIDKTPKKWGIVDKIGNVCQYKPRNKVNKFVTFGGFDDTKKQ